MAERARRPQRHRALRLLLRYEDRKLVVAARQEVEMATPPSDPVRGHEGQSGFWYEVRGSKDQVLYRRTTSHPIQSHVEVHDQETGPRRHPVQQSDSSFVVLVPDLPDATSLVVMSSPLDPRMRMAPATPLGRIPLAGKRRRR